MKDKLRHDITGRRFGKVTITGFSHIRKKAYYWNWICDCGNTGCAARGHLSPGATRSCGKGRCAYNWKRGYAGGSKTRPPEYNTWSGMIQRCTNPNHPNRKHYIEKGISVCDRWRDFDNFLLDMGAKPPDKHSIERRDSNGDYCPENCYWATSTEQNHNTSRNVWIEANGKRMIQADWARELGCAPTAVRKRLSHCPSPFS